MSYPATFLCATCLNNRRLAPTRCATTCSAVPEAATRAEARAACKGERHRLASMATTSLMDRRRMREAGL